MARSPHGLHGRGTKLLALLCSALLACTTVRTHVSTIAPEVMLREGHAVVQLDLWVESNKPLTPEEEDKYRAQARSALEQALAGRSQTEGQGALVLRTLGVSRTSGRRGDQTGAAVGIAVGIVAIVAVVIIALVADSKSGGSGKAPSFKAPGGSRPSGLPAPRVAVPRVHAPRLSGVPSRPATPPRFASAPAPRGGFPRTRAPGAERFPEVHRGPSVNVGVGVEWLVPLSPEPAPLAMVPPPGPVASLPPPADGELAPVPASAVDEEAEETDETAVVAGEPRATYLALPEPLPVESRGFFDGDRLVLDAVLVDPATGEVLFSKRIAKSVDPRDAKAVRAAVDELFSDGGWTPASPPGS